MFEVAVGDETYKVTFEHNRGDKATVEVTVEDKERGEVHTYKATTFPKGVIDRRDGSPRKRTGYTSCSIERVLREHETDDPTETEVIGFGVVFCGRKDQFSRRIGRKLAMRKAVDDCTSLDKEARTALWNKYSEVTNGRG